MVTEFEKIEDYLTRINLSELPSMSDLVVYEFKSVQDYHNLTYQAYRNRFYEISLEINRGCHFKVDQFEFEPDSNRLTIIAPGRLQTNLTYEEPEIASRGYSIFLSPDFLSDHLDTHALHKDFSFLNSFSNPVAYLSEADLSATQKLFELIHYEYSEFGGKSRNMLQSMIHAVFEKAAQNHSAEHCNTAQKTRSAEITVQFERICQERFQSKMSISEYAELLHITPKYLTECIKKEKGITALHMLSETRLNHAKSLLKQTSLSIMAVAEQSGFENPQYFSSYFKRKVGLRPSEYRNT